MNTRKTLDRRGPTPAISTDGKSVTFVLQIAGIAPDSRLIIRCDSDGGVWASSPGNSPTRTNDA